MNCSGAEIIIKTLIEQGADTVFGYPGGAVLNIYDALYMHSDKIKHIIAAHEQGAAHAADGYARVTGKVGVVIATSGPGATNLVTGIANAYLDSVPMVAITGNVTTSLIGKDSFQEVDIMDITIPITKHNYIVTDINKLADTLREAFHIAASGRPGPVLIDVPKDIQIAKCDFEPKPVKPLDENPKLKDKKVEKIVKLINDSKKPYIYCGGGVVISSAGKELMELSKVIDAPIGCSMMGLSAIPHDFKNNLGMQGMHGRYASTKAQSECDLLIAVGARFSDRATGNKAKYANGKKIVHIDIDYAEIDKNIFSDVGLVADVKDALSRIAKLVDEKKNTEWQQQIEDYRIYEKETMIQYGALTPYEIIDTVQSVMPDDAVVATDVGQHQMWVAQTYPFKNEKTFVTSGGLGTMGYGMGAAIGACIGSKKPTVLFTGDGSFGMNLNEMATLVSNNLPMIVVLMNNGVLGMVRQWQTLFYNEHYSSTTLERKTDFAKLAEAFGADGYNAENGTELREALEKAVKKGTPALINCTIDMDEFVLPMIPAGKSVDDIIVTKE